MTYIVASTVVLWFVNTFYLYQPASRVLLELRGVADKAAVVTLGYEPAFNAYAAVASGWVSGAAYLGLTLPGWIAGAASFLIWILLGRQVLRGRILLQDPPRFLLWLLYAGFCAQFAIAAFLARAGGIAGNLQIRLFPVMMLVALPLVAQAIVRLWREHRGRLQRRLVALSLSLLILWASGASLLKMTNDPWLSNNWQVWTVSEDAAVRWIETRLKHSSIWLGWQGIRVNAHAVTEGFGDETGNLGALWVPHPQTRLFLISTLEQALSIRMSTPLHDVRGDNRVYDSGTVAYYRMLPQTPYQK